MRLLILITTAALFAADPQTEPVKTTVVVTGTPNPIPLEEADRNVRSVDVISLRPLSNTIADLLKLDSSVDLRQRAGNGVQTDISIRGGTFGQTLVLLNGMRLNDVQSGHHNFDVPLPMESIATMEVLKGSGSTLYGSDAIGGAINFLAKRPETTEVRLRGALGNFGVNQEQAYFSYAAGKLTQQLSASRDFSTGFQPGRDYRNLSLSSITHWDTKVGTSEIILAHNDRPFGADQFYGNANSWERTKTWFASGRQTVGPKTEVSFAFRRHTDLFVLHRYSSQPDSFTNRHAVESFQGAVRRREDLGRNARLNYGGEVYSDSIASGDLGDHSRTRGAGYAMLDLRALRRFSLLAGVRDEVWGSGNHQVSPSVSGAYWAASMLKFRASASRAFRLPSYTELYYHDPFSLGSPGLLPERAWSYDAGVDWLVTDRVRVEATVFHRREQDGIDFVRSSPAEPWRATNFQRLSFTGVEAAVAAKIRRTQQLEVTYTALRGSQEARAGLESRYVFNYPENQAIVSWQAEVAGRIAIRSRLGVLQRLGKSAYAVWDVYGTATRGRIRPFLQFTNLANVHYQEISGVVMQGRAVVGGIEWVVYQR